jgi:hypothetical protein
MIDVTSLREDHCPAGGDHVSDCKLRGVQFRGHSPRTDQENMADFQTAFGSSLLLLPIEPVSIGVPR